jgi:acyl-CoA ligase (AMP-forming) (exosortase A-associated)
MDDSSLLHELHLRATARNPQSCALTYRGAHMTYQDFDRAVRGCGAGLMALGLRRGERVAIFLEKRFEMVVACFGAAGAGAVFVPVNPILKPEQVAYILRDCNVRVLVTSSQRLIWRCRAALQTLSGPAASGDRRLLRSAARCSRRSLCRGGMTWFLQWLMGAGHRVIDTDVVSILYTSGSTGRPKGVVLSHRNMVAGAKSVATYLENCADDTLVAALPLSFDAGFSQVTTALHSGARVVLLNYLLPRDVLDAIVRERVTGLTAVPPLYVQLVQLEWPTSVNEHLRYFANTGGRMPLETLTRLRERMPRAKPYLMYGLTEAFRSTYLPPEQVDQRPESIGRAIPNAEILVLREDGKPCEPDEPGELVHRGALVGMGYWNDPEKTAERYRPLPGREAGLVLPEIAVFSGDTVKQDAEGYLYFIGRRDEMMKTSGYRVSPTEVEEVIYASKLVAECAAFGVSHPALGQAIVVVVAPADGEYVDTAALVAICRERMPPYMVPTRFEQRPAPLPRNPNGKIDRKQLSVEFAGLFE